RLKAAIAEQRKFSAFGPVKELAELASNAVLIGALIGPETFRIAKLKDAGRAVCRRLIILKASTDADIDVAFEAFIQQRVHRRLIEDATAAEYTRSLAEFDFNNALWLRRLR